jgi:hypothetical protein
MEVKRCMNQQVWRNAKLTICHEVLSAVETFEHREGENGSSIIDL